MSEARRCGVPDGDILGAVPLPRLLMRLVDPANVYFADHTPRRRGPIYREATVERDPGGSRRATPEEISDLRQRAQRPLADADGAPEPPIDASLLSKAAHDLIAEGRATIGTGPHSVHARVVRFWRGDAVLEVTGENGQSRRLVRIPRSLGPEHAAQLTGYLTDHPGNS